ncbi:hypothetical protein C7974DRAFT_156147 [Boeremia exigua]|uniref:uncharacterized protein n=1 Tax=Boeremia exigua TaxID=749465 RepID=UPI001E8ECB16|nr:uncharacterized protein C7974DRAFT_156147 [Boeremia exigua]KAH6638205.1 hypothetical protein C7974DRAFT_156147 [Boeremia exigua]
MSLEIEPNLIRRGVWINLDHGSVMGKTITTDTQTGNIIVALLAVLSTLATAHLWHLITFSIHQLRATGRPEDALFRQQQALLRTLPAPSAVMADTIKLWWAWRGKAKRPLLRSLVLLIIAILFTVGTGAASVFSSLVVDTTSLEVLVKSRNCGWAHPIRIFDRGMVRPVKQVADPYANLCYTNGANKSAARLPSVCNSLVQRELPFTTTRVPCPFDKLACEPNLESVSYDTGLMDVGSSFGLNLPDSDGVKFRQKMTCSLMARNSKYNIAVGYSAAFDGSMSPNSSTNPRSLLFEYGTNYRGSVKGITWAVDQDESRLLTKYTVHTVHNYTNPLAPVYRGFDPRPELRRDNTTLTIIIVGLNSVTYLNKVRDPLFNATIPVESVGIDSQGGRPVQNIYLSNRYAQALACQEQYQFCYKLPTGEDECTELGELPLSVWIGNLPPPPDIDFSPFPNANEMQKTIIRLIASSSYGFNVATVAQDLLAGSLENPDIDRGLPDDQWLRELTRWQKQILAALQVAMIDYAIGPGSRDTAFPVYLRPTSDSEKKLCQMQKMKKSGSVVNVNVFGLSFIIAFSVLVALLDIFMLKFVIYLSKFRAALGPRVDRWIQDGIWQLQRRAYEGEGYRSWTNLEADVPLTTEDKLKDLAVLWLPSKSPNVSQGQMFDSSTTIRSQRSSMEVTAVENAHPVDDGNNRGLGILGWFRGRGARD